jgi:Undecaprenyl-phosphate galactose phosphotransferase WbaP
MNLQSFILIRVLPRWVAISILLMSDLTASFLANHFALVARNWLGGAVILHAHFALWPFLILLLIIFGWQRLYQVAGLNPANEIRQVVWAVALVYLFVMGAAFIVQSEHTISRGVLLIGAVGTILMVLFFRYLIRGWFSRYDWWGEPVLVLGAGLTGQAVVRSLRSSRYLGWRPVALLDDDASRQGVEYSGVPVVGTLGDAPALARSMHLRSAIVAMPGATMERLRVLELQCAKVFPQLIILPNFCGYASMWVQPRDLGGILGLEVQRNLLRSYPRFSKRFFDLLCCVLGLIAVVPLTLFFAALIKFSSSGPVFYGQERIGRNGRPFRAWKFRSMVKGADDLLKEYLAKHPEFQEEWNRDHKLRNDPRITFVGHLLRKTSLDELPQIWNVIRGEMSLVGPRPIVQAEIVKYRDLFDLYVQVRPGISGLWQVSGRNDITYDERVNLDAAYVRNWSIWLDAWILIRTVRVVVLGRGAY